MRDAANERVWVTVGENDIVRTPDLETETVVDQVGDAAAEVDSGPERVLLGLFV